MSRDICVVGSLNADLTVLVDRLPAPGETALGTSSRLGAGGKGANQAAAAAVLGGQVGMVGCVGLDEHGDWLRNDLEGYGVDVAEVRALPDTRTGFATIALSADGANMIIVDPGANSRLTAEHARSARVAEAAVVLLQLEVPLPAVTSAVEAATGSVVLNPAPFRVLGPDVLSRVDVLVPNLHEFVAMAGVGRPVTRLEEIRELVLSTDLPADLVVTLGENGAMVRPRGRSEVTHVPAPPVDVVDTTGAGDCLCGGLAVALAAGGDVVDATTFAVSVASISTTAAGARGRLPRRGEVAQPWTAADPPADRR